MVGPVAITIPQSCLESQNTISTTGSSLTTIPGRLPHSRHIIDHGMAKAMTQSEAETKRLRAVEFLRRIGKPEDAERFEAMSPRDYAAHKHVELMGNPLTSALSRIDPPVFSKNGPGLS